MASESIPLSLRSWPEPDPSATTLPKLIPRITEQHGHLRNVTEQGLLEQIRAQDLGEDGLETDPSQDRGINGNEESVKSQPQDIITARDGILQLIGRAHDDALRALDFVSLLLSKETPRQAEISMSPYLKEHVPLGSLGADTIRPPQPSEAKVRDQAVVSRGWKLQSLTSAADSLLRSATRLEKEIELETRYWQQVLTVSAQGWSVCQSPREKHTLSVRFGFSEATGPFKDQGLAAMRRGDDGQIILDQGVTSTGPKAVRVKLEQVGRGRDRQATSASALPSYHPDDQLIENLILRARNTIYEEELFYELGREARLLANQGVRVVDSTIMMHLPEHRISIDLVPLDDDAIATAQNGPDVALAEGIVLASRLLLSYAHRQNLRRRSLPPPPVTERKRPTAPYFILRSILTHLLHDSALRSLQDILATLVAQLRSAGLAVNFTVTAPLETPPPAASKTTADQVVERLIERTATAVQLTLPSSTMVQIRLRTQIHPPAFGREYLVSTSGMVGQIATPKAMVFGVEREMTRYLQHLATVAVVAEIASPSSSEESGASGPHGSTAGSAVAPWEHSAQINELQQTFGKQGRSKRMVVRVDDIGLELRWAWMTGQVGTGDGTYRWSGRTGAEQPTMVEIVGMAGRGDA
ncbi:MAG: RNA polymerase II mediator complex subunit [Thelocarpon superellum]|nr:MAG: RNA polymerase II mediator complex subunit [Thelocarpon superellum]